MPQSKKDIYLHVLKQYHDSLKASASLAAPHYATAIDSLTECPVPIISIKELEALHGFSAGVRRKVAQLIEDGGGEVSIERSLRQERQGRQNKQGLNRSLDELVTPDSVNRDRHEPPPEVEAGETSKLGSRRSHSTPRTESQEQLKVSAEPHKAKRPRIPRKLAPPKLFRPAPRSGGYGILVALYVLSHQTLSSEDDDGEELSDPPEFSKEDVVKEASRYCRSSYTHQFANRSRKSATANGQKVPNYATAWSGMKPLLNRGLVWQSGRPATFALSPHGWKVARELAREEGLDVTDIENDEQLDAESSRPCEPSRANARSTHQPRQLDLETGSGMTRSRGADDSSDYDDDADIFSESSSQHDEPAAITSDHALTDSGRPFRRSNLILPPKEPATIEEEEGRGETTRSAARSITQHQQLGTPEPCRFTIYLPPKENQEPDKRRAIAGRDSQRQAFESRLSEVVEIHDSSD